LGEKDIMELYDIAMAAPMDRFDTWLENSGFEPEAMRKFFATARNDIERVAVENNRSFNEMASGVIITLFMIGAMAAQVAEMRKK
jgi:hypothetical protein